MFWVMVWLVSAFIGAAAGGRNNAAGVGFLLGLIFGPLGAIAAFGLSGNRRKCPFCKEMIVRDAVKCPKCQSALPEGWSTNKAAKSIIDDLLRPPAKGPGFIFGRLTAAQQLVIVIGGLFLLSWTLGKLGIAPP